MLKYLATLLWRPGAAILLWLCPDSVSERLCLTTELHGSGTMPHLTEQQSSCRPTIWMGLDIWLQRAPSWAILKQNTPTFHVDSGQLLYNFHWSSWYTTFISDLQKTQAAQREEQVPLLSLADPPPNLPHRDVPVCFLTCFEKSGPLTHILIDYKRLSPGHCFSWAPSSDPLGVT